MIKIIISNKAIISNKIIMSKMRPATNGATNRGRFETAEKVPNHVIAMKIVGVDDPVHPGQTESSAPTDLRGIYTHKQIKTYTENPVHIIYYTESRRILMNIIWILMIFIGIIIAVITGKPQIINDVIIHETGEAVMFAIGLTGIMSFWLGLMNVAKKSGFINSITKSMTPITRYLFPEVPPNHPAIGAMMMNMVANMFGAGNSATALGLKAMEELQKLNTDKKIVTNTMAMFLVINMSSIQIIPLTILKLRSDAGSVNPTDIIITSILATIVSTIFGVVACKILEGKK
jgi:spore maturation protein A